MNLDEPSVSLCLILIGVVGSCGVVACVVDVVVVCDCCEVSIPVD